MRTVHTCLPTANNVRSLYLPYTITLD